MIDWNSIAQNLFSVLNAQLVESPSDNLLDLANWENIGTDPFIGTVGATQSGSTWTATTEEMPRYFQLGTWIEEVTDESGNVTEVEHNYTWDDFKLKWKETLHEQLSNSIAGGYNSFDTNKPYQEPAEDEEGNMIFDTNGNIVFEEGFHDGRDYQIKVVDRTEDVYDEVSGQTVEKAIMKKVSTRELYLDSVDLLFEQVQSNSRSMDDQINGKYNLYDGNPDDINNSNTPGDIQSYIESFCDYAGTFLFQLYPFDIIKNELGNFIVLEDGDKITINYDDLYNEEEGPFSGIDPFQIPVNDSMFPHPRDKVNAGGDIIEPAETPVTPENSVLWYAQGADEPSRRVGISNIYKTPMSLFKRESGVIWIDAIRWIKTHKKILSECAGDFKAKYVNGLLENDLPEECITADLRKIMMEKFVLDYGVDKENFGPGGASGAADETYTILPSKDEDGNPILDEDGNEMFEEIYKSVPWKGIE